MAKSLQGRKRVRLPRISVVIPAFNQAALTAQCLRHLPAHPECEIIVVDDASTDDTTQRLGEFGGCVKTVRHRVNRGFAVSCNDGAAAAKARDYLLFLNNDTLPQPNWLEALVQYAAAHPEAAVVGSKLLYSDRTIQHAGVVICQDRYPRHIYTGFPADHPAVNRSRRFQIVTAASMLIRRSVFEQAGGFDTAYQNGFEDVDLCLRLGQQGLEIHYCADSVACHLESVSPGRFQRDRENVALYRQRWLEYVRPDDLDYYIEDGLLGVSYEGRYPVHLEVSPLLATLDLAGRAVDVEQVLRERSREIMDLQREVTRLRVALGQSAKNAPESNYQQMRQQLRKAAQKILPPGATVLVISKGDGWLVDLPGCRGWHFPQTERGAYAGHHPADSTEAIAHLEALRTKGADYLLIPAFSSWWLDHYTEFRQHLESHYRPLEGLGNSGQLYALKKGTGQEIQADHGTTDHEEDLVTRLHRQQAELDTSRQKEEWLASALAEQRHARQVLEAVLSAGYPQTVAYIRQVVGTLVPKEATIVVVSRGDPELLKLGVRRAWHFPRAADGQYAGFHPADSAEAIAHLESLIAEGAQFYILPNTAFWWLEHYDAFGRWLETSQQCLWRDERCRIFRLTPGSTAAQMTMPPGGDQSFLRTDSTSRSLSADSPRRRNAKSATRLDVICFPIINWDYRFQRPQQLMSQFAAVGHRVFYLSHDFRQSGEPYVLRRCAENLQEVSLRGSKFKVRQNLLDESTRNALLESIAALQSCFSIGQTLALVQSPFWWPVVKEAAAKFAWPIVYDCLDHHAGFATSHPLTVEQERELLTRADLVLASSAVLEEKARPYNPNVLLLRNACDYDHFSKVPPPPRGKRPVIGYYGAIAEWFDSDLVADLAERRPDWDFVLVGSCLGADIHRLVKLANVSLPGEKPYAEIPSWLARFDVAIIPFKRTPVTEATNPVKAYEIFASGRPLVSVPLPEIILLRPLARIASNAREFDKIIETELRRSNPKRAAQQRAFAGKNTWRKRFDYLAPALGRLIQNKTSQIGTSTAQLNHMTRL